MPSRADHLVWSRRRPEAIRRRKYNTRLIKRDYAYSIQEIADLYGVHPQAVRRWVKAGLRTIDDRKPFLIHGTDLIAFLNARQANRKRKCGPDELYCFRCRTPRRALRNEATIHVKNDKQLNIAAVCERCEASMNRVGSMERIDEYRKVFAVQERAPAHISEFSDPALMCHLEESNNG